MEPADSEENTSPPQTPAVVPIQFLKELQTKDGLVFRATGNVSALRLEVTDLSGRTVYDSGFVKRQTLSWARVNSQNRSLASGVYLYRLTARDQEGREAQSELRKLNVQR